MSPPILSQLKFFSSFNSDYGKNLEAYGFGFSEEYFFKHLEVFQNWKHIGQMIFIPYILNPWET